MDKSFRLDISHFRTLFRSCILHITWHGY